MPPWKIGRLYLSRSTSNSRRGCLTNFNRFKNSFPTVDSDLLTNYAIYKSCIAKRDISRKVFDQYCSEVGQTSLWGIGDVVTFLQNFISSNAVREITELRHELVANLSDSGLIPRSVKPDDPKLNHNNSNLALLRCIILGGLWPQVARVYLPKKAIKFDQVQAGTVQRANVAKEFQLFDITADAARAFIHPGSMMFSEISEKSNFITYFTKQLSTKPYLRDVTVVCNFRATGRLHLNWLRQVPIYGILLFGGPLQMHHVGGGITVGNTDAKVYLRSNPRIGILINQLRWVVRFRIWLDH